MTREQLDLHIYRDDRKVTVTTIVAEIDDHRTIRQTLLDVAKREWQEYEPQIGRYHVNVHRAGHGAARYRYQTTPWGH